MGQQRLRRACAPCVEVLGDVDIPHPPILLCGVPELLTPAAASLRRRREKITGEIRAQACCSAPDGLADVAHQQAAACSREKGSAAAHHSQERMQQDLHLSRAPGGSCPRPAQIRLPQAFALAKRAVHGEFAACKILVQACMPADGGLYSSLNPPDKLTKLAGFWREPAPDQQR